MVNGYGRQEAGVTQDMLADAVGASFQQVQKKEKGTDRITASAPLRCAIILNAAVASVERGT
jgi:DNA-binding XRE family transcriptional regulator